MLQDDTWVNKGSIKKRDHIESGEKWIMRFNAIYTLIKAF